MSLIPESECVLEGIEVANLTHAALDSILTDNYGKAKSEVSSAEDIINKSTCMSEDLKWRTSAVVHQLRAVIEGKL